MRRRGSIVALVLFALWPRPALGDTSRDAQALFERGRSALAAKDYATACAQFEESLKLERAVGTLISLAQCEEATHKLLSAEAHWRGATELAAQLHDRLDRGPYARKKADELDARIPRVTLVRAANAPADTTVEQDGRALGDAAFAAPLRLDPGEHLLRVGAPGHLAKDHVVVLSEGERASVTVGPGEAEQAKVPSPLAAVETSPEPTSNGQRPLGWVAFGLGVASVGVGSILGLVASSTWSDAKRECGTGCLSDSPAEEKRADAETLATASTVAFAVGGAALVAGAVLLLTGPSARRSAAPRVLPTASERGGSISFVGRF